MKRLPDTEYEVMHVIWENPSPITTTTIMDKLGNERGWAVPALISMLNRLQKKGFLTSEKNGKMRYYTPLIREFDYLEFVTKEFLQKYHKNSMEHFVSALCDLRKITDDQLAKLNDFVRAHRNDTERFIP
jgi:predicted transcriptional regulator